MAMPNEEDEQCTGRQSRGVLLLALSSRLSQSGRPDSEQEQDGWRPVDRVDGPGLELLPARDKLLSSEPGS